MPDRLEHNREPEFFERLQRLAIHERRRRWDSARSALEARTADVEPAVPRATALPSDMVSERFEWLEAQFTAMARELKRVEHRSRMIALRARIAVTLGLIMATLSMGLWTGVLHTWFMMLVN